MKLQHTQQFLADLEREFAYWKDRNPAVARQLRDRVLAVTERITQFPESGRAWHLPGALELVVPGLSCIVIYRTNEASVETLKLFLTSREASHAY